MQPNPTTLPVGFKPTLFWRYSGAFILALMIAVGIVYVKNQGARNIVSGVVSSPADILKQDDGHTNIVLLGMGGDGHAGGDLTDSILFLSLGLNDKSSSMISIPRDIWIPSMQAKINTAYHYGNEKGEGGGVDLAKQAVSEVLGVPVHYALVLDFQGFVKAIDAVGGVDVEVERTFDDYKYPIPGKETAEPESERYEHVHFDQGVVHMDGTTALKFARSRHALGDEGTDFARGKRQEKIILAFKEQLFSTDTLLSSSTLSSLKDSISSSIDTDIGSKEQASFFKLFLGLGSLGSVASIDITDLFTNPPASKPYGGQWVLIPETNIEDIHTYVKQELAK